MKQGGWVCPDPSCQDLQFSSRYRCRLCGAHKPPSAVFRTPGTGTKDAAAGSGGGDGAQEGVLQLPSPHAPFVKLLVRRLPPGLAEKDLRAVMEARGGPAGPRVRWSSFWPGILGDYGVAQDAATEFSRFYLTVDPGADVQAVFSALHGHVFTSTQGRKYKSAVDIAPNRDIPWSEKIGLHLEPAAEDPLADTLDDDENFQRFKQLLEGDALEGGGLQSMEPNDSQVDSIAKPVLVAFLEKELPKRKVAKRDTKVKEKKPPPRRAKERDSSVSKHGAQQKEKGRETERLHSRGTDTRKRNSAEKKEKRGTDPADKRPKNAPAKILQRKSAAAA